MSLTNNTLNNCPTNMDSPEKPTQSTSFKMKKKKLEHCIDNLFKVVCEKPPQPDEINPVENKYNIPETDARHIVKEEMDLSPKKESVIKEENDVKYPKNAYEAFDPIDTSDMLKVKIKEDPDEELRLNLKGEPDEGAVVIKVDPDVKPAEQMFGWCNIEDLSRPSTERAADGSSSSFHDSEIKQEILSFKEVTTVIKVKVC